MCAPSDTNIGWVISTSGIAVVGVALCGANVGWVIATSGIAVVGVALRGANIGWVGEGGGDSHLHSLASDALPILPLPSPSSSADSNSSLSWAS